MCIFCSIVSGDIPSYKIYEDEYTYAFLDISDEISGHTLVIPKAHYENVLDIPSDLLSKVMESVQKISQHYVDDLGFDGVNILNASGVDAQQSVFHLHFHILPRKKGDGVDAFPHLEKANSNMEEVCMKLKLD